MSATTATELEEDLAYDSSDEDIAPVTALIKAGKEDISSTRQTAAFRDFMLKPELIKAITDCGFEHPSEVQNECIPQAILGTDIVCQAKSGMGKTAVFILAVLQQIEAVEGQVKCIVLCHARELAFQIFRDFERLKKFMPDVKMGVFFGGIPISQNVTTLKNEKPNIVIGTPGRILQLIKDKALDLGHVTHFVLDECDKMIENLDMRGDIQQIFKKTPVDKQVMMFSATMSEQTRKVCKKFMHHPLEIYIGEGHKLVLHGLKQYYVELVEKDKNKKLVDLLDNLEFNQVVVFVKSPKRAAELNKLLCELSFPSLTVHGRLPQQERIENYKNFKDYKSRILVTTNLFGRGIDMERVNIVIDYDMPSNADTYLHRVGRAGRFGTKGLAISFVNSTNEGNVLNEIISRFELPIPKLPDEIDANTYMQS